MKDTADLRTRDGRKLSRVRVSSTTINNALAYSSYLFPHSIIQMCSTDPSQDCVDDSEPERKRIRLQKAEDKKRRTRQKQSPPFNQPSSVETNGLPSFLIQSSVTDTVCYSEGLDGVLIEVTPAFAESTVKEIIGWFRVSLGSYRWV